MDQSEQLNELATALAKAQGEMTAPELNKQGYNYKYADLNSVWKVCRKPLRENGLSIIQGGRVIDGKTYLATRLCHSSGQWIETYLPIPDPKPSLDTKKKHVEMQDYGAFVTYLRRYSVTACLGINGDEDTDCAEPPIKTTYQNDNQNDSHNDSPPAPPLASKEDVDTLMSLVNKCPKEKQEGFANIIVERFDGEKYKMGKLFCEKQTAVVLNYLKDKG